MGGMLMDYMKEIKEISAEQAIILWQASCCESAGAGD